MVDLLEHEGKRIFRKYGIPVPVFRVIRSEKEVPDFNEKMVIKAQVPTGGRGKKGGVKIVNNREEAIRAIQEIRQIDFNGYRARRFILEKAYDIKKELYVSITLDRSVELPVLLASAEGGVDINSVPAEKILKKPINPFVGVTDYMKREAAAFLGLDGENAKTLGKIISGLYRIYDELDASLAEINPLALTSEGLVALDSKISIEDDALFRHPDVPVRYFGMDKIEVEAKKKGLSFVRLEGDIGIIANGAGLNMATIDLIAQAGGKPANFFDLGGTDDPQKVIQAIELASKVTNKVLFVNIFGGVTRCDTVANGIVQAIKQLNPKFKLVVRIRGANEEEGRRILNENGIDSILNLDEAVRRVVELAGE